MSTIVPRWISYLFEENMHKNWRKSDLIVSWWETSLHDERMWEIVLCGPYKDMKTTSSVSEVHGVLNKQEEEEG
jgi:hypothetical protein